jgi:arginyl-tRNA synthetase
MLDIFQRFEQRIAEQVELLRGDGTIAPQQKLPAIVVEPPRDPSHGDLATNAALALARAAQC